MKVKSLIKALEGCDPELDVYFEETQTKTEDGVELGKYSMVDAVYEVGVKENEDEDWKVTRVVLSNEEGVLESLEVGGKIE